MQSGNEAFAYGAQSVYRAAAPGSGSLRTADPRIQADRRVANAHLSAAERQSLNLDFADIKRNHTATMQV
jgi:hypothetical protein